MKWDRQAMLAWVVVASAQAASPKVAVLPFAGDRRGDVRSQVVQAIVWAGKVTVVGEEELAHARGPAADVPRLAAELSLRVVILGKVERGAVTVRMIDPKGEEIWSRRIALSRGKIDADNAHRLAVAVATAARLTETPKPDVAAAVPTSKPSSQTEPPPPELPLVAERAHPVHSSGAPHQDPGSEEPATEPGISQAPPPPPPTSRTPEPPPPQTHAPEPWPEKPKPPPVPPVPEPEPRPAAAPIRERDEPPANPRGEKPPLLTARIGPSHTWRSFCARPGVGSCNDYDALSANARPIGPTADLGTAFPYVGGALSIQLLPFRGQGDWKRGVGLSGSLSEGIASLRVRSSSPAQSSDRTASGWDQTYAIQALYRADLPWWLDEKKSWVGGQAGYAGSSFEVTGSSQPIQPTSHRRFFTAGVQAGLWLSSSIRIEAQLLALLGPTPSSDEVKFRGTSAASFGWEGGIAALWEFSAWLGVYGELTHSAYSDRFTGSGTAWPSGGAQAESSTAISYGVTFRY